MPPFHDAIGYGTLYVLAICDTEGHYVGRQSTPVAGQNLSANPSGFQGDCQEGADGPRGVFYGNIFGIFVDYTRLAN